MAAAVLMLGATAEAQPHDYVQAVVSVPNTDPHPILADISPVRFYEHLARLPIAISVRNESGQPITLQQSILRGGFSVRVRLESEIAVVARWRDEAHLWGSPVPSPIQGFEDFRIEPFTSIVLFVDLERQDGLAFESGSYLMSATVGNLRTAIRTSEGDGWSGTILGAAEWLRGIVIQPPTDVKERVRVHILQANAAIERNDYEAAWLAYKAAAAVDPADMQVALRVGMTSLITKRYQEAVNAYEAVIARSGRADISIDLARDLAKGYLGTGDRGNALRVLRMSGIPEAQVSDEIGQISRSVR